MSRRGDTRSRSDINENVDRSSENMREKGDDMDIIATDVETVRDTLENLESGGTTEGADAVEVGIRGAEDVTEEEFDDADRQLEDLHTENEAHEQELDERSESVDSDLQRISDASATIETQHTVNELVKAKDAALQDISFISEQITRAKEAREESERVQSEYQQRVHGNRSSR